MDRIEKSKCIIEWTKRLKMIRFSSSFLFYILWIQDEDEQLMRPTNIIN